MEEWKDGKMEEHICKRIANSLELNHEHGIIRTFTRIFNTFLPLIPKGKVLKTYKTYS